MAQRPDDIARARGGVFDDDHPTAYIYKVGDTSVGDVCCGAERMESDLYS